MFPGWTTTSPPGVVLAVAVTVSPGGQEPRGGTELLPRGTCLVRGHQELSTGDRGGFRGWILLGVLLLCIFGFCWVLWGFVVLFLGFCANNLKPPLTANQLPPLLVQTQLGYSLPSSKKKLLQPPPTLPTRYQLLNPPQLRTGHSDVFASR